MWKEMDISTLEREYSPSSCVDNFNELIEDYSKKSRSSESKCNVLKDLSYGSDESDRLDLFPSNKVESSLMIFIHGGYWQALSKNESTFAGFALNKMGTAFAAIDYTLAPEGTLEEMINQCTRAIKWLFDNHQKYGYSNRKIYLSGSSAGAHLATMAMIELRKENLELIQGCILMSGVYDLMPIVKTYINNPLKLTDTSARELSPIFYDLSKLPNAIICYGENETSEFKRQSREFAANYKEAGSECECFEVSYVNHFDIVHTLNSLWLKSEFEI